MNDLWTNRLSEYLDDELDTAERAALEAHLATCGQCYATLADLRQVVEHAKSLVDREPATNLWPDIRARLTAATPITSRKKTPTRRFSFSIPQLLAASIALALLSGGGAWMTLKPSSGSTVASRPKPGFNKNISWTSAADAAVSDLQDALTRNESRLDTATVRVVRQNLAVIDRAIADARAALQKDPGNTYLNLHLADTMRRKVELLRRVNALVES